MTNARHRILSSIGRSGAVNTVRSRGESTSAEVVAQTGEVFKLRGAAAEGYVSELLRAARAEPRPFRHGKYTHVSDVIHRCIRKLALNRRVNMLNPAERLADGHAITYAQGHAIHDFVKGRFIKGHPNKVWAKWRCVCGETTTEPMTFSKVPDALLCERCGRKPDIYVESAIEDDEHQVTGAPDVILYLDEFPAYYVTEIKSMAKNLWAELERPVPDHVVQALFYWMLMQKKGYSMVDQLSLLYVKKEMSFTWPYKEFVIEPSKSMHILTPFLGDLGLLASSSEPGAPLPPRVTCASPEAPEAKKCNVCVTCFQMP